MAENMVIDILRIRFRNSKNKGLNYYWNMKKGRFHDFSYLIDVLERLNRRNIFGPDKDTMKEIIRLVKPFRRNSSSTAHSLISDPTEDEIVRMNIPEIMSLLHHVRMNI
jgi:hypothetical protein